MLKKPFLLPAVLVLCLAACKTEPDLPDDPHVPLVNPFIGVWKDEAGKYWQFKTDGTGGWAEAEAGPFLNDFSFFIFSGQDVRTAPDEGNLVILDDSGGELAVSRYQFYIIDDEDTAILRPMPELGDDGKPKGAQEDDFEMEKLSGSPQVLSLTNPLIGEISADWWTEDLTGDHAGIKWSIKYRADGTVKTYHHQIGHQFENAYALRGNTLVIFGFMRFAGNPVIAKISSLGDDKWQVQETQTNPGPAKWEYTKVDKAKWRD
jgi:hypothetical protein